MKLPKTVSLNRSLTLLLIAIILTASITYVLASSSSGTFTISQGVYPGAPSYTIWRDSSTLIYYAKNAYGVLINFNSDARIVIQSAATAIGTGGGKISISPATYTGNGTAINIAPRIEIVGEVASEIDGGGVVKFVNLPINVVSQGAAWYRGAIRNIDFESNANTVDFITIADCAHFEVSRCGFYKGNIHIRIMGKSHFAVFKENRFTWGNTAILLDGNPDDYGKSPDVAVITGNTFGANYIDIHAKYSSAPQIHANYFETGPTRPAVHIKNEDSNFLFASNNLFGAAYAAHMYWQLSSGGAYAPDFTKLIGNHFEGITGHEHHAIRIETGSYGEIQSNTFKLDNGGSAIYILSEANHWKIMGNIVTISYFTAIYVESSNTTISGNTVLDIVSTIIGNRGIDVRGSNSILSDNHVYNAPSAGIYVESDYCIITNCIAQNNAAISEGNLYDEGSNNQFHNCYNGTSWVD